MRGIEFFKSSQVPDSIRLLEIELKFSLPDKYVLFASNYHMGRGQLNEPKFFDPKFDTPSECGSVIFRPEMIGGEYLFSGFFNRKELLKDWNNYSKDSHEFMEHGLLRIADIGIGGGLFLGLKDSNYDKVFVVNWDKDEDYYLIAEDIFQFSNMLVFQEDKINLGANRVFSQLYKNWGEDFWRVREG